MNLYPRNRYLSVTPIEKEEEVEQEKVGILLPDDYQKKESPVAEVRVKGVAPSCSIRVTKGDRILIERSMLQEVEVEGSSFYLILENYVYGVLNNR